MRFWNSPKAPDTKVTVLGAERLSDIVARGQNRLDGLVEMVTLG